MKQTISILGVGWLGFPLAEFLLKKGYNVKGSTTSEHKIHQMLEAGIQLYLIDIRDRIIGIEGEDFFEATILIITIPPKRDIEKYIMQMEMIAESIQNSSIQHIIYTSSTGVYGNSKGITTENTPLLPEKVSSKAVVQAEQILKNTKKDLTICRLAGLYGGKRQAGRFLAGRKDLSSGNAPVNLVHQEDCIHIITQIIEQEKWNEIFNVCSDNHPPRKVFYPLQAQRLGLKEPVFVVDDKPSSAYKMISNEKVKTSLGYTFKHNIM